MFLLFILPLVCFDAFGLITELNDKFVRPAIIEEAGYGYVIQSYAALASGVLLPIAGAFIRKPKM